ATSYFTLFCIMPVTSIVHLRPSVRMSYMSPIATAFEGLILAPPNFTLPSSQARVARLRVLNMRMAHKYLSTLVFSLLMLCNICRQISKIIAKARLLLYFYHPHKRTHAFINHIRIRQR